MEDELRKRRRQNSAGEPGLGRAHSPSRPAHLPRSWGSAGFPLPPNDPRGTRSHWHSSRFYARETKAQLAKLRIRAGGKQEHPPKGFFFFFFFKSGGLRQSNASVGANPCVRIKLAISTTGSPGTKKWDGESGEKREVGICHYLSGFRLFLSHILALLISGLRTLWPVITVYWRGQVCESYSGGRGFERSV